MIAPRKPPAIDAPARDKFVAAGDDERRGAGTPERSRAVAPERQSARAPETGSRSVKMRHARPGRGEVVRLHVYLAPEMDRTLAIYSASSERSKSEVVSDALAAWFHEHGGR